MYNNDDKILRGLLAVRHITRFCHIECVHYNIRTYLYIILLEIRDNDLRGGHVVALIESSRNNIEPPKVIYYYNYDFFFIIIIILLPFTKKRDALSKISNTTAASATHNGVY